MRWYEMNVHFLTVKIIKDELFIYRLLKRLHHWPEIKLDRALSGVWLGRHDQTVLTSVRGKKQLWSGCSSSFEPLNTDIYCDVCIIILCLQRICITPVLLYAIKYVNVIFCKSVDNFPMKRYSFCITYTAYATNDATIIHHIYNLILAVCFPLYPDRKLGAVCHLLGDHARSSILSAQRSSHSGTDKQSKLLLATSFEYQYQSIDD